MENELVAFGGRRSTVEVAVDSRGRWSCSGSCSRSTVAGRVRGRRSPVGFAVAGRGWFPQSSPPYRPRLRSSSRCSSLDASRFRGFSASARRSQVSASAERPSMRATTPRYWAGLSEAG